MPRTVITNNADDPAWIGVMDVDADDDMDVVSVQSGELGTGQHNSGEIVWYENTDGQGLFGAGQQLTSEIGMPDAVFFSLLLVDIDGDEDVDILSKPICYEFEPWLGTFLTWYENTDGRGTLSPPRIIPGTSLWGAVSSATTADVDGDGDLDIIAAGYSGPSQLIIEPQVFWYENQDGSGDFTSPQRISLLGGELRNAWSGPAVDAKDMDGDQDVDVIVAGYLDGTITWYENTDGHGSFGTAQLISSNHDSAWSVHVWTPTEMATWMSWQASTIVLAGSRTG